MSDENTQVIALRYLINQSDSIAKEIEQLEKRIIDWDDNHTNADGVVDIRLKYLIDKCDMLTKNQCHIREKIGDFLSTDRGTGGSGNLSGVSVITGSTSSSSGASKSASKKRSYATSTGNQTLISNDLNSTGKKDLFMISREAQVVAAVPDGVVAMIDRAPGGRTTSAMNIDNGDETVVFVPSGNRSAFSSNDVFGNTSSPASLLADNSSVDGWPNLKSSFFQSAHCASYSNNTPVFPTSSSAPPTPSSPYSSYDFGANVMNRTPVGAPPGLLSSGSVGGDAASVGQDSTSGVVDASALQTDEYVNMKKHIASLMRQFHEKKLYFIAIDGTPIFAQHYQTISQFVKAGEPITNYMRGQMVSYVIGVDKKKQTVTKNDLFLPDCKWY